MTDVELRLQADVSGAQTNLSGFRKEYQALVREVQKPLQRIDAFRDMETSLEATQKAAGAARDRIRDLGNQIATAVAPSKALQQSYRDSVSELQRLERAEAKQVVTLAAMRAEMQAAGVDTTKLAAEQARLRAQLNTRLGVANRSSALQEASQSLGVNRYRELGSEIGNLRSQFDLLKNSGTLSAGEIAIAQQTLTKRIKESRAEMDALQGVSSRLKVTDIGTGAFIAGTTGVLAVAQLARMSDAYSLMSSRLKLATGSQDAFNEAQGALREIATRAAVPVASLTELFTRINQPMKEAGSTQKQTLGIVEAVALSFKISGASAEEASNSSIQFAQALGAGALRGEEFNSVADTNQRLIRALADGLGVTTGALKNMANNGLLTATVVTKGLSGQLENLRKEAEQMPQTVGGAMTQLGDTLNELSGSADMKPLIDQIKELTNALKDPDTREGLVALASALTSVAALSVKGAAGFAKFAESIGYNAAKITGNISKLDKVDKEIEQLKEAIANPGITSAPMGFLGSLIKGNDAALVRSKEQNEILLEDYQEYRSKLLQEIDGLSEDSRKAAEEQVKVQKNSQDAANQNQAVALQARRAQQQSALTQLLSDTKKYISEQEKLEQEQLDKIEELRKERISIEKKYQATIKQLNSPVQDTTASYANAEDLKVAARQSLAAKNPEEALKQAEAARQMLLELQKAGQSTYGLSGFAKELEGIELAANDLQKTQADEKLDAISTKLIDLRAASKELENIQITPKLDEEAASKIVDQMKALAEKVKSVALVSLVASQDPVAGDGSSLSALGLAQQKLDLNAVKVPVETQVDADASAKAEAEILRIFDKLKAAATIPITLTVNSADNVAGTDVPWPGYASGGHIRGPGSSTSDSILARLSDGEFVVRAAAVRHYGPEMLHALNSKRLPAFATGGEVGFVPHIPDISSAASPAASQAAAGRPVMLSIPGLGDVPLQGDTAIVDGLERHLKILAIQKGSNRRRGKAG